MTDRIRKHYARIVPRQPEGGGIALCNGTKVVLPGGEELPGVQRVTIHGEVNSIWTATIDCVVEAPELPPLLALIGVTDAKPGECITPLDWTQGERIAREDPT